MILLHVVSLETHCSTSGGLIVWSREPRGSNLLGLLWFPIEPRIESKLRFDSNYKPNRNSLRLMRRSNCTSEPQGFFFFFFCAFSSWVLPTGERKERGNRYTHWAQTAAQRSWHWVKLIMIYCSSQWCTKEVLKKVVYAISYRR